MRLAAGIAGFLLAAATCGRAQAQTPAEQLARGVRSYQNLDFDNAAASLRAALGREGPAALGDTARARGLAYLGATELFRGRRDSAVVAFNRLALLDPRYRIDQLVFPPEVTGLFQQVRLTLPAASAVAPAQTQIASAGDRLAVWVYVTTYHQVDVAVARADGSILRSLFRGGVGDSVQVRWDGRTVDGTLADSGSYLLRVDSRGGDGRIVRSAGVPLDLVRLPRDTLPLPAPLPDSLFKPEHSPGRSGFVALMTGLAAAAAVVALPSVVAGRSGGSAERFVVAGALGAAGVVGYPLQRRPAPIPANIAANQALRLAWQRQADSVHAENAARVRDAALVIRAARWRPVATP